MEGEHSLFYQSWSTKGSVVQGEEDKVYMLKKAIYVLKSNSKASYNHHVAKFRLHKNLNWTYSLC